MSRDDRLDELLAKLDVEVKIKDGAENLLRLIEGNHGSAAAPADDQRRGHDGPEAARPGGDQLRLQVERELRVAGAKIAELRREIEEARSHSPGYSSSIISVSASEADASPLPYTSLGLHPSGRLSDQPEGVNHGHNVGASTSSAQSHAMTQSESARSAPQPRAHVFHPESPLVSMGLGLGLSSSHGDESASSLFPDEAPDATHQDAMESGNGDLPPQRALAPLPTQASQASGVAAAARSQAYSLMQALAQLASSRRPSNERVTSSIPEAGVVVSSAPGYTFPQQNAQDAPSSARPSAQAAAHPSVKFTHAPLPNRSAPRSRAAALAAKGLKPGETAHARTPSHATGLGDLPRRRLEIMSALTRVLKGTLRVRYELDPEELVSCVFPCLSDGAGKECRAATYRLLRHALVSPPWPLLRACHACGLDIYLVRTLMRDSRFDMEREQALKLLRTIVELGSGTVDELGRPHGLMSVPAVRAVAACADHADDKLHHICLETLTELALFDLPTLIRGGGLRIVLQATADGPYSLAPVIMQTVLCLTDRPSGRAFLKPGTDLEVALGAFTDVRAATGRALQDMLRSTSQVLLTMLGSWTGLLVLCQDNRRALRSIILALQLQKAEVQEAIIDTLLEFFEAGMRKAATMRGRSGVSGEGDPLSSNGVSAAESRRGAISAATTSTSPAQARLNLVDHYLSLVLALFVHCGIVEAITRILETTPELTRRAAQLMGVLTHLAARLLPPAYGVELRSLPYLFDLASRFEERTSRAQAMGAFAALDQEDRARLEDSSKTLDRDEVPARDSAALSEGEAIPAGSATAGAAGSEGASEDRRPAASLGRSEKRTRPGTNVDDATFRNLLLETQVLATRDHQKWNFEVLMDLLEGPLLNARRLDEAMRGSKFGRRLMSFLQPFSMRFSNLASTPSNECWVRLACTVIRVLVASEEGVRVLAESKLLSELHECIAQLLPDHAGADGLSMGAIGPAHSVAQPRQASVAANQQQQVIEPIFTSTRLAGTLTGGYVDILATLSETTEGLELMERFQLFSALYRLSDVHHRFDGLGGSRADLLRLAMDKFHYHHESHCRVLLAKALTCTASKPLRLFATQKLGSLLGQQTGHGSRNSSGGAANKIAGRATSGSISGGSNGLGSSSTGSGGGGVSLSGPGGARAAHGSAASGSVNSRWIITLLLGQLYDVSTHVRELAAGIVQTACSDTAMLESVVAMRPALDHLGETSHPLLLKFLSSSVGFRYMMQGDYIDRAVDNWFHEKNQTWTSQVEVLLADAFDFGLLDAPPLSSMGVKAQGTDGRTSRAQPWRPRSASASASISAASSARAFDGTLPPHFYGELTRTPEGCAILERKGHFAEFTRFLYHHGLEADDTEILSKLKATLWAVGNIGSTPGGFAFLEADNTAAQIVEIATRSEVLSIRGTCFFVLGLISTTRNGAEALAELGWHSVSTVLGVPLSLCLPHDIDSLVSVPPSTHFDSVDLSYLELAPPHTGVGRSVSLHLANLANSIVANKASRHLVRLKAKHATYFARADAFCRALEMMNSHHVRLPVRRYIWDLFGARLDQRSVDEILAARAALVNQKRQQEERHKGPKKSAPGSKTASTKQSRSSSSSKTQATHRSRSRSGSGPLAEGPFGLRGDGGEAKMSVMLTAAERDADEAGLVGNRHGPGGANHLGESRDGEGHSGGGVDDDSDADDFTGASHASYADVDGIAANVGLPAAATSSEDEVGEEQDDEDEDEDEDDEEEDDDSRSEELLEDGEESVLQSEADRDDDDEEDEGPEAGGGEVGGGKILERELRVGRKADHGDAGLAPRRVGEGQEEARHLARLRAQDEMEAEADLPLGLASDRQDGTLDNASAAPAGQGSLGDSASGVTAGPSDATRNRAQVHNGSAKPTSAQARSRHRPSRSRARTASRAASATAKQAPEPRRRIVGGFRIEIGGDGGGGDGSGGEAEDLSHPAAIAKRRTYVWGGQG